MLEISTQSFDEAIWGQTRVEVGKDGKAGCPGTDVHLLLCLHKDGSESLQVDGWHL